VYANNYADVFPGLSESIEKKDYGNGLKWADIIKNRINQAAKSLD
jgi:N-acetylated-alpha-linked acidic dipeptidase